MARRDIGTTESGSSTRRTRSDGRETAAKILKFAEDELNEFGHVNFNLDRVIEKSGVSRSSVYHHFGGREGVIAGVETHRLITWLDNGLTEMQELLANVNSGEEAFALVELGIVMVSGSQVQQDIRRQRISTLAMSYNSPATQEHLKEVQAEGTQRFAEIIRELKNRGLCHPIEPIEGTAHFIQSILLGRVLVDILDDPVANEQWQQSTISVLRHLINPN